MDPSGPTDRIRPADDPVYYGSFSHGFLWVFTHISGGVGISSINRI